MSYNDSFLEVCNTEVESSQLPGIVFVSILVLCGFSSNALFLMTYLQMKMKYRCGTIVYYELLMYVCILDLVTCSVTMPLDVLQQRYPFTLLSNVECKLQHYTKCVLLTASIVMTLVIAVHRYRKISSPLSRQMTFKIVRFVFGIVVLASMVLHAPVAMVTGQETFRKYNVSHVQFCGISDGMLDSNGARVLFYVWISVFCILTVLTIVLYGGIGINIRNKESQECGSPTSTTSTFFRPTSEPQNEIAIRDNTETNDGQLQANNNSTMGNKMELVLDVVQPIGGKWSATVSKMDKKQPHNKVTHEAKTLVRCKTMPKDYRLQMAELEKPPKHRPKSQELLSALKLGRPLSTRRARSFGNINELNTTILRTKQNQQRKQRHDDILRAGMLISVTYFLSIVPFSVAMATTLRRERFGDDAVDILIHLGVRSLYLRPTLNPLLYGLFDGRLRRFFLRILKRLKENLFNKD